MLNNDKEIFNTEVKKLIANLLLGNFLDKIGHLCARAFSNNAKHLLLKERYECYQDSFDRVSEFMLSKYWNTPEDFAHSPVLDIKVALETIPNVNIDIQSHNCLQEVYNSLELIKNSFADSAFNSILDDIEVKLRSLEYRIGF